MNNGGTSNNNMYYGQSRPGTASNYSQQNYSMNTVLMDNPPPNNAPVNNSITGNKNFKKIMIGMSLFMLVAIVM